MACAVATPAAAAQAGVRGATLGEVLVFARTSLLARMPDAPESDADRLCALLRAGLSPWLGRPGAPSWDTDESDAYTITGRRLAASFAQVNEAWQRRLADPPAAAPAAPDSVRVAAPAVVARALPSLGPLPARTRGEATRQA